MYEAPIVLLSKMRRTHWLARSGYAISQMQGEEHMRDTIDMAHEVYGAHTEWTGAPLDRLEQLVAIVRADQREIDAKVADRLTWADNKGVASAIRARGENT